MIDLLEAKGLHLTLKGALEVLRPQMPLISMNAEVENVREVLESFITVLVDLSDQERAMLLLCPRLPQFSMPHPSKDSKGLSQHDRFRVRLGHSVGSAAQIQLDIAELQND